MPEPARFGKAGESPDRIDQSDKPAKEEMDMRPNLSFFLARRYFRAKKAPLVTLIGRVAVLSIGVSTAAMMLILSVMNGMNRFVSERFWMVESDLRVEAAKGKFFEEGSLLEEITGVEGVEAASAVLKDQAMLSYGQQNCMIYLQGVDSGFSKVSRIGEHVFSGRYLLESQPSAALVLMGGGVFAQMQIPPSQAQACKLYAVDASRLDGPFGMQQAISSYPVYPSGLFSCIPEYDNQYVFSDLEFARRVFKTPGAVSAVEVKVSPEASQARVKVALQEALGEGFTVKDRVEQQQSMFKSMRVEKLLVTAVFAFVMLIATFTMVANQMLLMHEKRLDMAVLSSMGMRNASMRQVFFFNGMLVTVAGTIGGLAAGTLLTFGQQRFGWVELGGGSGNYITDAYPVHWQLGDLFVVLLIGLAIGAFASAVPLRRLPDFRGRAGGD